LSWGFGLILEKRIVPVVVGLLFKGDQILVSQRAAHKIEGGTWEFPGGKVESGETLDQALIRELAEELGIRCIDAEEWMCLPVELPDRLIRLFIFKVYIYEGYPKGLEGQEIRWVSRRQLQDPSFDLPSSNRPIVEDLNLYYDLDPHLREDDNS
jgi:8-oxo-dGTP diphosphatase